MDTLGTLSQSVFEQSPFELPGGKYSSVVFPCPDGGHVHSLCLECKPEAVKGFSLLPREQGDRFLKVVLSSNLFYAGLGFSIASDSRVYQTLIEPQELDSRTSECCSVAWKQTPTECAEICEVVDLAEYRRVTGTVVLNNFPEIVAWAYGKGVSPGYEYAIDHFMDIVEKLCGTGAEVLDYNVKAFAVSSLEDSTEISFQQFLVHEDKEYPISSATIRIQSKKIGRVLTTSNLAPRNSVLKPPSASFNTSGEIVAVDISKPFRVVRGISPEGPFVSFLKRKRPVEASSAESTYWSFGNTTKPPQVYLDMIKDIVVTAKDLEEDNDFRIFFF